MAHMPGVEWIGPTPNQYTGGMVEHRGLVLHIQQGTEDGSEAWFKNPAAQASAHFLNPKAGGLRQLVDTDDAAWTEMAGNRHWVSVENEGMSGDSLTDSQLENAAQLLAWLNQTYAVPLRSTDDPNGQGVCWHGAGGDAWGGHYDCPGEPIKAQRPAIIARAQQILGQPPAPAPAPAPAPQAVGQGPAWPGEYLSLRSPMLHDDNVRAVQQRLIDRGWTVPGGADGWYGQNTRAVVEAFQRDSTANGWPLVADGIVGPATWRALWNRPVS